MAISDKKRLFWEFSYLMLVVPLIFPHQQKYAFVMILPAVAWVLHFIFSENLEKKRKNTLIALLIGVWFLTTFTTDGIIGKHFFQISQYYKLITWGTMLLIIPLSMTRPKLD
ncbi:MAG: hypothetical protein HC817_16505 [Saprospiraceae bacterium]|nr:hypothetical protein [Saprospiraceae bacterium]